MSKISRNIRHLRTLRKLSQEQLAIDLNITRARLGSYEEGRSEPSIDMLVKLSNYFQVAVDALVKADLTKSKPDSLVNLSGRLLFPVYVDTDNNELIEVVPAKASAGYLNGYSDPEYFEHFQKINLPFIPVGKHRAFTIKGDSMPPLIDGSLVVGKYVESIKDIKEGKTYVLLTRSEGVVYKRVYRDTKAAVLMLHSDNKSYQPYPVKLSDILEMWEFTCCLHLSDAKPEDLNTDSIMHMLRSMQVELASLRR